MPDDDAPTLYDQLKTIQTWFNDKQDKNDFQPPASTNVITHYRRGKYGEGVQDPEEGKHRTFYTGTLKPHQGRSLGFVDEILEEGAKIEDQEKKMKEVQKALLEESILIERMKTYKPPREMCCTFCCGDPRESCCPPCIKCYAPCSYDPKGWPQCGCIFGGETHVIGHHVRNPNSDGADGPLPPGANEWDYL